jgi:hypothetical protein
LLDGALLLPDQDLVNFVQRKSGDFDRRVADDQFLELDLEFIEIPLALLAEAVAREPSQTTLDLVQMSDADAREIIEPQ